MKKKPILIHYTEDYSIFHISKKNRPLDLAKHRQLEKMIAKYGYLPVIPLICKELKNGKLDIVDGQHRLAICETRGLGVWYVITDIDFDVAELNGAMKPWTLKDYAMRWAADGKSDYQEIIDFSEGNSIPMGDAAAMLAGCTGFSNVKRDFASGDYKVKDRFFANAVASIYVPLFKMNRQLRQKRFLEACMAVCRVDEFEPERLVSAAERCREKLVPYSTRDAFLRMLDEIYNRHRSKTFPLEHAAINVMRERKNNAIHTARAALAARSQAGK